MSRTEYDSVWRAQRRIITVLDSDIGSAIATVKPAGLNVSAPDSDAYFALPSERSVRQHATNHNPRVYVYPDPGPAKQRQSRATQGTTTAPGRQLYTLSIAFFFQDEGGAADYSPTWKSALDPDEREYRRLIVLAKSAKRALEEGARDGDDIANLLWQDESYGLGWSSSDVGTWARQRWEIDQQIDIRVQNTPT